MDWKKENIKNRFIYEITDEEAHKIAWFAIGEQEGFSVTKIERTVNGNNIPHVKIFCKYFEIAIMEEVESFIGVFHNLNIYQGDDFGSVYCQREIFDYFKECGF